MFSASCDGLSEFTTKYSKIVDEWDTDHKTREAMKNLSSLNQFLTQDVHYYCPSYAPKTIHIDVKQVDGRVQAHTMTFNESTRSWGDLVKK